MNKSGMRVANTFSYIAKPEDDRCGRPALSDGSTNVEPLPKQVCCNRDDDPEGIEWITPLDYVLIGGTGGPLAVTRLTDDPDVYGEESTRWKVTHRRTGQGLYVVTEGRTSKAKLIRIAKRLAAKLPESNLLAWDVEGAKAGLTLEILQDIAGE